MANWYCARTYGDTRAAFYLARSGLQVFRPEVHRYRISRGKERHRVSSLLPGYVFVALTSLKDRSLANEAIGVAGLLGNYSDGGFMPKEMPSQWVEALREAGPKIIGKKVTFKEGMRVRVAVGALVEEIVKIEGVDKCGRLVANMQMFGSVHQVKIDPSHVEMVDGAA